jgi:pSer/pThr/pTyr-binding forkhead associated (FHA) protein
VAERAPRAVHTVALLAATVAVLADGRVHYLRRGEVVAIGRLPGNVVALDDARVSRRHAEVRPTDSAFEVKDRDSTNGTHGARGRLPTGSWSPFASDDWFRIGHRTFDIVALGATAKPAGGSDDARL